MQTKLLLSGWLWRLAAGVMWVLLLAAILYAIVQLIAALNAGAPV
jgi:hypothetical protein